MTASRPNYLKDAWLVLALALTFGGALAGIDTWLSPRIAANRLQETVGQIPALVPGAVEGERETVADRTVYRALDEEGRLAGWVLVGGGQGFADRIEVLIGLSAEATEITGLYILEQKETPGLGNRIMDADWRRQFAGQEAGRALRLAAEAEAGAVEALTGATISSESVVDIVNRTVAEFRAAMTAHERSL